MQIIESEQQHTPPASNANGLDWNALISAGLQNLPGIIDSVQGDYQTYHGANQSGGQAYYQVPPKQSSPFGSNGLLYAGVGIVVLLFLVAVFK